MSEDRDAFAATKLTRTEFAVVRAYAQGMRPVDIANRYLVDPDDDGVLTEQQAIARILTLRDRLVQFALQHDRPDVAQMFEALRARSDVGMTRRVDALASLEILGQSRPSLGHEVGLWFRPNLTRRLKAAGIQLISDLTELANCRGSSWWRSVPGIGPKSASVITRWLVEQRTVGEQGDRALVRAYVVAPADIGRRPPIIPLVPGPRMTHPVPLEHMLPGPAVTVDHRAIGAPSDLELVKQWLSAKARTGHTLMSYRKEAERLLLWTAREQLRLTDLSDEALQRYAAFLSAPEPATFWCGPASPRDRAHWRPFEGPLNPNSQVAALRVVQALLRALHKMGYIGSVAPRLSPPKAFPIGETKGTTAVLVRHHIDGFLLWLSNQSSHRWQAALAAALLVRDGFKLSELDGVACEALRQSGSTENLLSTGAGSRPKPIALQSLVALQKHCASRGLGWPPPASAALLAPTHYPPTQRGNAKYLAGDGAGYCARGLDQLLRAAWKAYVRAQGLDLPPFTPRQIRAAAG